MPTIVSGSEIVGHNTASSLSYGGTSGVGQSSAVHRPIPVISAGILFDRGEARPAIQYNAVPAPSAFQSRVSNQIIVMPLYKNVGSISESTFYPITVWNSYPYEKATVDQDYPISANLTDIYIWPLMQGYEMAPGSSFTGEVYVDGINGPSGAVNTGTMSFTVDPGGPAERVWSFTPSLSVARGGVVFPFPPNTGQVYGEKFKWNTNIVIFDGGREQRSSLKDYPSLAIEASYAVKDKDLMYFNSLLWGWQGRDYLFPLWHLGVRMREVADAGANELITSCAAFSRMKDGSQILLWLSPDVWQVVTLQSKVDGGFYDPSNLTVDLPLNFRMPKGAYVFPLRRARMEKEAKGNSIVANLSMFELRFTCLDDEEYPAEDSGILFEDAYVVDVMPNWVEPLNESAVRDIQEVVNDVGKDYYYDKSEAPSIIRNFYFWFNHITDTDKFYRWLFYRRGSANAFWLPSGKADMAIDADVVSATSRTLSIKYMAAATMYSGSKAGREAIYIELKNGRKIVKRIDSITYDGGSSETLTLRTPVGTTFEASQVRIASFMGKNRLSSDEITIEWKSDTLMIANSNMTTLIGG